MSAAQEQTFSPATLSADTALPLPASEEPNFRAPGATDEGQPGRNLRAWQEAVVAMGRRAIAPPAPSILMDDAAALLAEMLNVEYSAAAELVSDGRSLDVRLSLRQPQSTEPQKFTETLSADSTRSLAGYVLQVAHPVAVADLAAEQRFTDPFLRRQGIHSAVAVPLRLQDRAFGALLIASGQVHEFEREDALLMETIAHLVTTTVARQNSEEALSSQRRLSTCILQTLEAMVLVLSPEGEIVYLNPACERRTGFKSNQVAGQPFVSLLPVPAEAEAFGQLLRRIPRATGMLECQSDLSANTPDPLRVAWSCTRILAGNGEMESIVVTGIDITQQCKAEQRAVVATAAAEEAQRVLAQTLDRQTSAQRRETDPASDEGASPETPPPAPTVQLPAFQPMPVPPHAERRRRPRRSYPYTQRVAPVLGGELPSIDQFVEVQCNDIAAGGFSYLSPTPPLSDTLVVALGAPPFFTFLTAQVAHITRLRQQGQRMFLIGCSYIGRANYTPEA